MAHPKRERFIPTLLKRLDREPAVVWDQINSRWDTGRRALLQYDHQATHHLVIQDDAIPCRDLVAGVEKALDYVAPGSPVGLYFGRRAPYPSRLRFLTGEMERSGDFISWIRINKIIWGVGIVIPTAVIPDAIRYCDEVNVPNYDLRLSRFFEVARIPVWFTWPSLVEHRDSPSLIADRTAGRVAFNFLGADKSALDVDWSGKIVSLPTFHR